MPMDVVVTVVGVFVGVALVAGTMASLALGRLSPERRRLNELVGAGAADAAPLLVPESLAENTDASLERAARWLQKSPKDMNRLRRRMAMAGYRSYEAALAYSILELVLPAIGFITVIYFLGVSGGLAFAMLAAAVGYFAPSLWLTRRIEARKRQIRNGLPDALDLFIVCVESGSSLDQAISKAGEEFALAHPALAEELRALATEIRAGKPRLDAFHDFADRTKVDDVRALVAMLAQTDRFGTSIAQALRTHAETSRTKRRQRAEERAAKLGVKLVFPLVLCLFPAFYVVTIGPAIVQFLRVFVQGTAGK
jgi:tight adherence protein C